MTKKYSKKRYQKKQKSLKKGGCGCGSKILGGNHFFAPTYNPVNISPYMRYDSNTYEKDPSYPPFIQSSRNLSGGGKKSKRRVRWNKQLTRKSRSRKMKGGNTSLAPQHTNPIMSFGTVNGAFSSAAILNSSGSLLDNSSLYNNDKPALV